MIPVSVNAHPAAILVAKFAAKKSALLNMLLLSAMVFFTQGSLAETSEASNSEASDNAAIALAPMDNARLDIIIRRLDPEANGRPGFWELRYEGYTAAVITDENADRMRIVVQVAAVEGLDQDMLFRVLQANFDTALDARYAIAKEFLWSTFIHPLSRLDEQEFASGVAQTFTLARTFGQTYSSGALRFRGGDTEAAEQDFYQQIIEQFRQGGQSI